MSRKRERSALPLDAAHLVGTRTIEIHFDGGCRNRRGAYGTGYGSFRLRLDGQEVIERRAYEGKHTCNTAEWETLLEALRFTSLLVGFDFNQYQLDIRGDSMLVIRQLQGKWRCHKAHLAALRDAARALLQPFASFQVKWLPRAHSVEILGH